MVESTQTTVEHESAPELAVEDRLRRLEELINDPLCDSDPALKPLAEQVGNHLRHVTYNFRVAEGSTDFPYELRRSQAYPQEPTERAIAKADRLFNLLETESVPEPETVVFEPGYGEKVKDEQDKFVRKLIADPMAGYNDLAQRRQSGGEEASFPELGWTLKGLQYAMYAKPEVAVACAASPILTKLRNTLLTNINAKVNEGVYGYTSTILAIEDAVAFLDIVVRATDPEAPDTYHSARFEYNWHGLLEDQEHTLLPTGGKVNSEDLLRLRGVPMGLVWVESSTQTVDGFPQTPYELFMHDVDHTRRMHEETLVAIEREGVSPHKYYEDATKLINDILGPNFTTDESMDADERDRRIAMRMILFEVLHEDAYDPVRDTIADAILRAPTERTPFERVVDGKTIEYFMSARATVLAHVFRKLAHTFYDLPEKRSTTLGTDYVRTRTSIAQAAADLYRLVSDDPIDDESLLTSCMELVSTDENFSDSFIGNIAKDIKHRAVGRRTLSLMISKPLGVTAAVRQVRSFRPKVHTLFGYAALEYEDPDKLEETVAADLTEFDPTETAIAIGATPYGINRVYRAVKGLGFMTLGIVASTALGRNEESAEAVDEIIVVRDSGWGGNRYTRGASGLLSPTTRVFVGASDSIAAYGGGEITAVTLEEMLRREKSASFKPFDMNHRIADMMHAQRGATGPINYAGPADTKWRELNGAAS